MMLVIVTGTVGVLRGHSIIYRSSDVSMPAGGVCGHDKLAIHRRLSSKATIPEGEHRSRRVSRSPFAEGNTRCILKVIADDRYYKMITSDLTGGDTELKEAVVISFISSYVDRVREIYEQN